LATGFHSVCDIYCVGCRDDEAIGWKYVAIFTFRLMLRRDYKNIRRESSFLKKPALQNKIGLTIDFTLIVYVCDKNSDSKIE
jgi:hypothetical protein